MKTPLLVICGPTATGKTDLGIYLAQKLDGEIISADSRQVYKGMTIGTGKKYSDDIVIWGYDLVSPTEDFSVSHFATFAKEKVRDIVSRGKVPILVGGTGLYIQSVIENLESVHIPRNAKLREELEGKAVTELQARLLSLSKPQFDRMNQSDKQNPRRLIRAIEIALAPVNHTQNTESEYDVLFIGLTSNLETLHHRVERSVDRRVAEGFKKEVTDLLASTPLEAKSMSATGYREMAAVVSGDTPEDEAIRKWKTAEKQYVKRQLTWFKKWENIHWFDVSQKDFRAQVAELVESWHNKA